MPSEIYKYFNNFINADFHESEDGIPLLSKVRMIHVVIFIGVFFLIILGVLAFFQNSFFLGLFDLIFAFSLVLLIVYLRKTKKYNVVAITGCFLAGFFYVFILSTGGVSNTASLWLYTYPLFTFFLLKSKEGIIANTILITLTIIYFLIQNQFDFFTKYSSDFILRFIPSFLVVFLYVYLFADTRDKMFDTFNKKNLELEKAIKELETNEIQLTKLSNELEQRVVERTAQLGDAKKRAETSEKIKTEFLAQMSHEIRSPLNVVLSFIDLIRTEVGDDISEEMKMSFQSINSASYRIIRTIELILNMTDIQLGSYETLISEIDVTKMVTYIKDEYTQSAINKNIELTLEIKFSEEKLISDEYALGQIISNLVDNAIKYTDKGYVKIIVEKCEYDKICFKIEDSGIGMSEDYLPSIFNSFTQEEQGYSRKFDGNGLGMALVKNYCNIIFASINVKSKKGIGTTFSLTVPNLKVS